MLWHSGDSTKRGGMIAALILVRPKAGAEAEHRIVMHDAAFDPISAIPARDHLK
jgi:hypothetical protein